MDRTEQEPIHLSPSESFDPTGMSSIVGNVGGGTGGGGSSVPPGRTPDGSGGIIDSLISGDRKDVGGVLCNDPSGLCSKSRGNIDSSKSGIYTSIVRLAAQLDNGGDGGEVPLVSIETEKAAILVKEYDGHTVVLRVPVTVTMQRGGEIGSEGHGDDSGETAGSSIGGSTA